MKDKFDVTFKAATWDEVRKLIEAVQSTGVGEVVIVRSSTREVVTKSGLPRGVVVADEYIAARRPESAVADDIARQFTNAHVR